MQLALTCNNKGFNRCASTSRGGSTMRLRPSDGFEEIGQAEQAIASPRALAERQQTRQTTPGGAVLRIGEDVGRVVC